MTHINKIGLYWESLAKEYLISKWFKFIAQNFNTKVGEIDLIFLDNWELVFVEVKTRTNSSFGEGVEAIRHDKVTKIFAAWQIFCEKNPIKYKSIRLDIISIMVNKSDYTIDHFTHEA